MTKVFKYRAGLSFAGIVARIVIIGSLALSATPMLGQSTFGTILGTVHDQSGALIPGCAITIENVGTSSRRAALTDESQALVSWRGCWQQSHPRPEPDAENADAVSAP